jgi:uncharacterized protein (DUF2249 family)
MDTVLDFRAFDQDPDTLKIQFDKAKIPNSNWTSKQLSTDLWEVFITKKSIPQHSNCCGICGNE